MSSIFPAAVKSSAKATCLVVNQLDNMKVCKEQRSMASFPMAYVLMEVGSPYVVPSLENSSLPPITNKRAETFYQKSSDAKIIRTKG